MPNTHHSATPSSASSLSTAATGGVPAVQFLRERVRQSRRRQNLILLLNQFGLWLLACTALFVLLIAAGLLFSVSTLGWRVLFVLWAIGVFAASFYTLLRVQAHLQNEKRFIHYLETQAPDLEQRLLTSMEFSSTQVPGVSEQFIEQLWQDAKQHVESARPLESLINTRQLWRSLGSATAVVAGTLVMLNLSDAFLQAGRQFVWPWERQAEPEAPAQIAALPISVSVEPGDVSLQRGDDLTITASLDNGAANNLVLYIQEDNVNWRSISMTPAPSQPAQDAKVFSVDLTQLSQDLVYYVQYEEAPGADRPRSQQYKVTLFDLPKVDSLAVSYRYPQYTGLENKTEDPGGDVVAPEGTFIDIAATLNKNVTQAQVRFDDGTTIDLAVTDKLAKGSFQVAKDAYYQIHLRDADDYSNKNPAEYYVRSIADQPPEVVLRKPGRDQDVMPLEEVAFEIDVKDDYGVSEFVLNYSVIGADDTAIDFLSNNDKKPKDKNQNSKIEKSQGSVKVSGDTLIYLEDLYVQPGDVVSYSITAADNNALKGSASVISDIYFLQVVPTEREFSRAGGGGAGGGGGGGGGDSSALVTNQKDVISATWKLNNRKTKVSEESFAADGDVIRLSQEEVAQRTQMSINRLTERGDYNDDSYDRAVEAMQKAIVDMQDAAGKLEQLTLTEALAAEQRALQSLLRAEAQINKTQISMNRQQGGGGGGGDRQEQADLRELFEMEMGELENRYELPQQAQSAQGQQGGNELMERLKELARRQERLARAQRELARRQMDEEQKRKELEQLRRQQEQLRRDLQQLAQSAQQQNTPGQQSSSSQSSSQSASSSQQQSQQQAQQQGQGSSQGQNRSQQNRLTDSGSQQLQQAIEQMEQAANSESAAQAAAKAQKALESLREQQQQWERENQQSVADLRRSVEQQAQQLVTQQQRFREQLENVSRQQSLGNSRSDNLQDGAVAELAQTQREQRQRLQELSNALRTIATQADENERRVMDLAHDASRAVRPIEEKMDTSEQILDRGMINLSLKLEQDIEDELVALRRQVQQISGVGGGAEPQPDGLQQAANQVRELRRTLEQLEQQANTFRQPDSLPVRSGERSPQASTEAGDQQNAGERQTAGTQQGANNQQGAANQQGQAAGPVTREQMQETLNRGRQLAQGLAQAGGRNGGRDWSVNARSIRTELTQTEIDEFLRRPDLLRALLEPVIELENKLRVQSELNQIDHKLYSALDEDIPEQYKKLVETYYKVLSESRVETNGRGAGRADSVPNAASNSAGQ